MTGFLKNAIMFFVEIAITIAVMSVLVILARLSGRKTGNNDEVIQLKKKVDGLTAENMELKRKLDAYKTPATKDKTTSNKKFTTKPFESNKLPVDFELTDDFKKAFELMEKTDKSIFLTGKAGTGKSTLVEYFRIKTGKKVVFLAPTGVAALNIGAKTIHSLFKFPPEIITSDKIRNNTYKAETEDLFRNVDVIVVDEISMVRADLVEGINYILQKYRDKDEPFGGVQMIFIGDMYQLPPVVKEGQVEITHKGRQAFLGSTFSFFQKKYGGPYFFNSDAYKLRDFQYYELNTNFRQKNDAEFMEILNSIRENDITEELLGTINKQCNKEIDELNYKGITLCTTNGTADRINKGMMDKLKTRRFVYEASLSGVFESEISVKDYPVERVLIIKKNAQVMMMKNDREGRWVNGTIGIVGKLTDDEITVEINGVPYIVNREIWEAVDYKYDAQSDKLITNVIGTYTQYPLKPAWAITIHKSQGKTFEDVIIDLGNRAFAHGQTYVALSRCKTLKGITLKRPIKSEDIILDDAVVNFIKEMKEKIT